MMLPQRRIPTFIATVGLNRKLGTRHLGLCAQKQLQHLIASPVSLAALMTMLE